MPTVPKGDATRPTLSFQVRENNDTPAGTPPGSTRSTPSTSISSDGDPDDTTITFEPNPVADDDTQIDLNKQPSDWRFPYSAITGSGVNVVRVRRTRKVGHGYTLWQSMIPFSGTSKDYFEAVANRLEELNFNSLIDQNNIDLASQCIRAALDAVKNPDIVPYNKGYKLQGLRPQGLKFRGTMRHNYNKALKAAIETFLENNGVSIPDQQAFYDKFEEWLKPNNLRTQYSRRGSYATSRTSWNALNPGDRTPGEWFDIRGNHEINELVEILNQALLVNNSKLVTTGDNTYNLIAHDGIILLSIVDDPDTLLVSITIPSDLPPDRLFQAIQIRADMNASHRQGTTSNTVGIFFGSNPLEYIEDVVAHLGHGFHIENFAEESKKARDALQSSTYSDDQIKAALARLDIASKYAAVFSISTPKKLQKGTKMKVKQVREAIKNELTHATKAYFDIINATPPQSTPSVPTVTATP